MDLHAIFKDEIRANFKDNVYTALGNKLQLDGEIYLKVSKALTSYDMGEIIRSSPMAEDARQKALKNQIAGAESALTALVAALDWPKYTIDLNDGGIQASGPSQLSLYAHKSQPILFVFENRGRSPQTVRVASGEVELPVTELKLEPGYPRYLLGWVSSTAIGNWTSEMKFNSDTASRHLVVAAEVHGTAVFEGLLVAEEHDPEPAIARVRVTDAHGRYIPPEAQPSGLIRTVADSAAARAERWCYADGKFRVRVPVGKIKVSIRRGLEYRGIDEEIDIPEGGAKRKFVLGRWAHMEKNGWYGGDMHVHMLDPKTALFESRAEHLHFVNVMVFKHLEEMYTQEHFTGGVDPVSDDRHYVYYNEEFRNEPMGHVGLINLKKLVEPISTGRLGLHWPRILRYGSSLSMPLPSHGDADSPDFPLLLRAMQQAHKQGGLVSWAHLRSQFWEFPLDAEEHQLDLVDIMTHTEIPQDLQLWYSLMNCDFHIPACAGTDRMAPFEPIGHQRVYVRLDAPLSYLNWMKALKTGCSFVTNGPMVELEVNGLKPGGVIHLSEPKRVNISARTVSQLPFKRLEIVVNGETLRSADAKQEGLSAELAFDSSFGESVWITARCMGTRHPELFYHNPVFAHTNAVYISFRKQRIAKPKSAEVLLGVLRKLENWAEHEAYFDNDEEKKRVLTSIRRAIGYFETILQQGKNSG